MKLGTPGFIGARLREAREARTLTAIALSEMVGVTRQAISQYEMGTGSPRPEVMKKIAETLNIPERRFVLPINRSESRTVFYRSMNAATKTARARAQARYGWLREMVDYLRGFVEFPKVNFPDFKLPVNPTSISYEEIEELATETRRFWDAGDGPIGNIVWLLENNGTIVARDELAAHTLDAFSEFVRDEMTPYVILGSDKASAVRSRFDAAHELGHLILHRNIDHTRLANTTDFKLIEDQAFRFAGAFLLPEKAFAQDLYSATLDSLKNLKPKWRVSIGAMIKRAANLELISEDKAQRLWIQRSRLGWNKKEPLDDQMPIEEPRLLLRGFEFRLNEKAEEQSLILAELALAANDVEALSGLPAGSFKESPAQISEPTVHILKSPRHQESKRPQAHGLAEIRRLPTHK